MKNNFLDKRLIVLFFIMIVMILLMFYFLKNYSVQKEDVKLESINNLDVLETKKNTINKLLDNMNQSFDSDLEKFLNNLQSYVNLPLKLEAGDLGNHYPFGNYVDTNEETPKN